MSYARPGVYISERLLPPAIPQGITANAAGAVVAPFESGPESVTLVQSWYEFTKYFGGYNASYPATFEIGQFFQNGGRELYVKRLLHADAAKAHVDLVTSTAAVVATATARNAGSDGNNLRVTVETGTVANTYTLSVYKEGVAGTSSDVTNDVLLERYENVVFADSTSTSYAISVVNSLSSTITLTIGASPSGTIVSTVYPLSSGSNGTAVTCADYINYKGDDISPFDDLTATNRALVLFLPGVWSLATGLDTDGTTVIAQTDVFQAAIFWASANGGFVICHTAAGQTVAQAQSFGASLDGYSNAAVYYPLLYITDPVGRSSSALRLIGPSGSVAGLYLSTDAAFGPFKAPAGITTSINGIVSLEKTLTSSDLDTLNTGAAPVNPIRQIPGAGFAVMGARTLLQDGTANKYVNMRRSLIYIERELKNLTEFALFENNDEKLWARLNTTIGSFLNDYRNQGGLRGATAAQAYFVRCDATNNTATTIANGEVHIQVGVALQYPAEFIVIDLTQTTLS